MESNGLIDNFVLPDGAREDLLQSGFRMQPIGQGIEVMSGHDRGVAYSFFTLLERNEKRSKIAKIPQFDKIHMVMWHKSKRYKPTEQVRFLSPELLSIDEDGNATGSMAPAWERYIKGLQAPGTPLTRWSEVDDTQIATLAATGVFSVEQFAAIPANVIRGKYTQDLIEKWDLAVEFVNGQKGRFEVEEIAKKAVDLETRLAKKDQAIEELQAQVKKLMEAAKKPAKKKNQETTGE